MLFLGFLFADMKNTYTFAPEVEDNLGFVVLK